MNFLFKTGSLIRLSLVQRSLVTVVGRGTSSDVSLDSYSSFRDASVSKQEDALLPVDEEELDDVAPELRPTFNLAAYANKSSTLQKMIHLGVDLTKWEKQKDVSSFILRLNFEEHMKDHIMFLHDVGIAPDDLGAWLSRNPLIFKEEIDDLQTRCNYLLSKQFDASQIARIISTNPKWLLHSTVDIDMRLGFFQRTYKLTNSEVRYLTVKQPKLITHNLEAIKRRNFDILEEMGFTEDEMKSLLLSKPKIFMNHYGSLMRRFDYVHNKIGFSHSQIVEFPKILTSRDFRVKQRHSFLKFISRDQFDRTKPNYISPDALVAGDDVEFCTNIAKTSVIEFNNFLKTL